MIYSEIENYCCSASFWILNLFSSRQSGLYNFILYTLHSKFHNFKNFVQNIIKFVILYLIEMFSNQAFLAEAMLIMSTILHLGKSGLPTKVHHAINSSMNFILIHSYDCTGYFTMAADLIWLVFNVF